MLCTTADNQLFAKIFNNSDHVLQKLLLPHIIQITISDTKKITGGSHSASHIQPTAFFIIRIPHDSYWLHSYISVF